MSLISIITASYNAKENIERTILSVISQTYKPMELLVIDGGSTDGTVEVIRKYEKEISYWCSKRDSGIYDAMNKGIKQARGDWIIFMNSGDLFADHKVLEEMESKLDRRKWIVYGDAYLESNGKRTAQIQKNRHLDLSRSIIHQSIFYQNSFLKNNLFDTRYKIMADYDHILSVSAKQPSLIVYVPYFICIYDKTGISSQPVYTYFNEYYHIAFKRMSFKAFIKFNGFILPRLIWSIIKTPRGNKKFKPPYKQL
jgi:glycosyltransferase involved in cell wall biosynthesis